MTVEKLRAADFWAEIKDHSMTDKGLNMGDVIFFSRCDKAQNGDIVAAAIDEDIYIRTIWHHEDSIVLSPANANYSVVRLAGDEMNSLRILGKAIAYAHELTSEKIYAENRDHI